jgi:hypothetical protein
MRIYKCDRCGEKFGESKPTDRPSSPSDNPLTFGATLKLPLFDRGRVIFADVDLCGSCIKSLSSWAIIEGLKEKK